MADLFRLLAVAIGCYVAWGLATGEIYAKSGLWGRTFRRNEDAWGYWSAIAGYSFLSLFLASIF